MEEEAHGGREGTELAGGVAVVSQMLAESELAFRVLDSAPCRLWEIYFRQLCNVCACGRGRRDSLEAVRKNRHIHSEERVVN